MRDRIAGNVRKRHIVFPLILAEDHARPGIASVPDLQQFGLAVAVLVGAHVAFVEVYFVARAHSGGVVQRLPNIVAGIAHRAVIARRSVAREVFDLVTIPAILISHCHEVGAGLVVMQIGNEPRAFDGRGRHVQKQVFRLQRHVLDLAAFGHLLEANRIGRHFHRA